jgi:hypothetical protein
VLPAPPPYFVAAFLIVLFAAPAIDGSDEKQSPK